jgi:hypothetical protein
MVAAFGFWDVDLWIGKTAIDHSVVVTVDSSPWTFYWISRSLVTICLILTWLYFLNNSVVGSREESTRILTRR